INAGVDPESECAATDPTQCKTDGFCDGAGACRLFGPSTACVPSSCIDTGSEIHAHTCDGTGNCIDNGSGPCTAGYVCKDGGCKTSCADGTDCAKDYNCIAGSCKKRPNGTSCSADTECDSGHCADGVCCTSACQNQCEAC